MAMKLQISEILNKLSSFKGKGAAEKRIEWLRQNDSPTLRLLLKQAFDPNIVYGLPDSDPPFKRNPGQIDQTETNLFAETRKLSYLWVTPSNKALESMSETQKSQLEEAYANQEAAGVALNTVKAEADAIFQRIRQAHEDITAASERLRRAQAEVAPMQKKIASVMAAVKSADERVKALTAQISQINKSLTGDAPEINRVPSYRLEAQFIQLLEALHPDEADVLLAVKNKALDKKYAITADLAAQAFPGIL